MALRARRRRRPHRLTGTEPAGTPCGTNHVRLEAGAARHWPGDMETCSSNRRRCRRDPGRSGSGQQRQSYRATTRADSGGPPRALCPQYRPERPVVHQLTSRRSLALRIGLTRAHLSDNDAPPVASRRYRQIPNDPFCYLNTGIPERLSAEAREASSSSPRQTTC